MGYVWGRSWGNYHAVISEADVRIYGSFGVNLPSCLKLCTAGNMLDGSALVLTVVGYRFLGERPCPRAFGRRKEYSEEGSFSRPLTALKLQIGKPILTTLR